MYPFFRPLNSISIVFILFGLVNSWAQSTSTSVVKSAVATDTDRLVKIFKDIHQNQEPGFMEMRTSGIVAKELKSFGYEVTTGIGKTGVVGMLKNGDGPIVLYRADMDANSVEEVTGLSYARKKIEKMLMVSIRL